MRRYLQGPFLCTNAYYSCSTYPHQNALERWGAGLLELPADKVGLKDCTGSSSPCPAGLDYGNLAPLPRILMLRLTSAPELPLQAFFLKPCLACQVSRPVFLYNLSKYFSQTLNLNWLVSYKSFLRIQCRIFQTYDCWYPSSECHRLSTLRGC